VADSAFIVAMEHMKRMEEFFDSWQEKVHCDMMRIMMEDRKMLEHLQGHR
jgi:hypothetical protein